jgi:hypothetical protein
VSNPSIIDIFPGPRSVTSIA